MIPLHQPAFSSPPAQLGDASTIADAGRFLGSIPNLETSFWDGGCGLLSPRRLQRKAWVYGAVFSEQFIIGCAIVDAGLVSSAFIYLYNRDTRTLTEYKATAPLQFSSHFKPSPSANWSLTHKNNSWSMQYIHHERSGWHFTFNNEELDVSMTLYDHGQSICALNKSPSRAFHYTHKAVGLTANIQLSIHEHAHNITDARGAFDFSLGYPPRSSVWQWACFTAQLDDGRHFSCNLVAQFMNGLENAAWIEHLNHVQVIPLAQAIFNYNPSNTQTPWRIHTADQRLQIVFTPEGARSEHINLGVLASSFTQPFGQVSGTWRDDDGSIHTLTGLGVVEQHKALW